MSDRKRTNNTKSNQTVISSQHKKQSKYIRYKLTGSAILLLAFFTQWSFFNYAQSKENNWTSGLEFYSRAYTASLIYVSLYFTQGQTTEVYDGALLQKAAQENAMGFSGRIAISTRINKDDKIKKINQVLKTAQSVNDIDSYNAYINLVSEIEMPIMMHTREEIDDLHMLQDCALWVYLAVYLIGSFFILLSIKNEE